MDPQTRESRHPWLGVGALLACATLWSLNGPLIKLLDQAHLPAITIACYRSLIGGLIFLPLAAPRWRSLRQLPLRWPLFSIAAFTLMTACFVIATTMTAAANAIILQYTSPIWVAVLAPWLLRERLGRSELLVLAVAMVGVLVIFLGHPTRDIPALAIGLASGLGYGALTVALRGLRRLDARLAVALNFLGSGLLLVPAVGLWGSFGLSGRQLWLISLLSVVQFALPYLLFSWALRHVAAGRAALIVLLETVLNPLLTWLLVGERVPTPTLIGGPIILASVASWMVLTWQRERKARSQQALREN